MKRNRPSELEYVQAPTSAEDIARPAKPVFERHNIDKAVLFGSFATVRQSRKNDVDLILIQRTPKRYFEPFEGLLQHLHPAIRGR